MTLPGVDIRPLRQMTGDAEFNEVYLTDVHLPADAQLGPEGKGWQVATTTLMNERVSIGSSLAASGPMVRALELFRDGDRHDPVLRDHVVRLWIESEVGRMVTLRAAELGQTGDPGPVGSIGKLFTAEHALRAHELTMDLLGPASMLYGEGPSPQRSFLRSRANTIEGGTSEVMRNILGERVLGLPRDDHGPKDRPWKDIPRS
jgi:alkylation response protein AidB-like acyl-CoA dehydrogenase